MPNSDRNGRTGIELMDLDTIGRGMYPITPYKVFRQVDKYTDLGVVVFVSFGTNNICCQGLSNLNIILTATSSQRGPTQAALEVKTFHYGWLQISSKQAGITAKSIETKAQQSLLSVTKYSPLSQIKSQLHPCYPTNQPFPAINSNSLQFFIVGIFNVIIFSDFAFFIVNNSEWKKTSRFKMLFYSSNLFPGLQMCNPMQFPHSNDEQYFIMASLLGQESFVRRYSSKRLLEVGCSFPDGKNSEYVHNTAGNMININILTNNYPFYKFFSDQRQFGGSYSPKGSFKCFGSYLNTEQFGGLQPMQDLKFSL